MENYNIQKLLLGLIVVILGFHGLGCFGCHKDERDALLQLKSAINYPNGTALPDWKEEAMGRPSDCCDWAEVECELESGRVVSLYLDSVREAEWYLNASLFLPFPHLQLLDLSSNSITGWTHHLRQLSSLEELYLNDNKLKGMIDLYDVEALQNLQILDLSGNGVDGFKRIHGCSRNNSTSKLERLFLDNIKFQDANTLLDSLSSFPSLKILGLSENDFSGVIETTGRLCQLNKIEELDIANSGMQGQLPLCLRNLTSLKVLALGNNNLDGALPFFLANLTSLQFLDLSFNQLGGNLANSPLTKLTSLLMLSLPKNKFQIPHTFFRSLANHSSLTLLFLDGNNVIPDYTTNQPFIPKFQLSFLSLSNCNLSATLPCFILHQYNLTYLDLSHNLIDGSFPTWIVENNTLLATLTLANNLLIGSLHSPRLTHQDIKFLDVSYNNINYLSTNLSQSLPNIQYLNFSRNSIKVLNPLSLCDMTDLNWLDLCHNGLTGEMPNGWLKSCFSLEALFLSQNALEVIPSLINMSSLKFLLLNNNNFSGTIQSGLFPISLELLDLSNNHLEGQIPTEMCKLNYLISINLSNNSFSGFLPPCFNSPYLLYVYLYKNKLNGHLLPVFRNNTFLVTLDLGDNHLSGVIPEWIGNLHNLSILSLQNNHFKGHIPTQVCFLEQLTILDLSSNNITGQIPRCLSQMTFQPSEIKSTFEEQDIIFSTPMHMPALDFPYQSIVLPDNGGSFSQYLTFKNEMEITTKSHIYNYAGMDLDGMTAINLACNKLSGEIPPEIGGMIGVRALNLSHNKLTDSIPSSLSNLSHIESLDLSYNNLNGSIPSDLINLNALEVFSVANNNLSGRTPEQKAQFGTFEESSYEGNPFLCEPPSKGTHKHMTMENYNIQKLLLGLVIVILGFHGLGSFGCHKDERDALLQLKSAINYPNGTALPDWKEEAMGRPSNCCDWFGVYCGESGRVISLYLDSVREAEWYLNASLFLPFPHLQFLDLSSNSITGWTHHLRQLSSLDTLYLNDNELKGMIDLYDVEALQNLQVLDLSGNGVDGFKRIHGCSHNNNTSKLEKLYLDNIKFQDANTLLDSLSSFPSLRVLHLSENDFSGVIETTGWLCQLNKIEWLVIANSGLQGQLPLCWRNLTSLLELDLGNNSLDGGLPLFLANLTSLDHLDLSSNHLFGNLANSPLTKLTSLMYLLLSNNRFQVPHRFFRSLANHSSLFLDGNNVIPDYTTNQPFIPKFQLDFLSLSNCNLSATLPGFILHQYNLMYLDLSHNLIDGSFPTWIVENNTLLATLTLANNLLIGSLHPPRLTHSDVKFLDVSYNNINDISTNLSQSLPNIWYLNFSKNSISVITPSTFGDLKNLSWLDLSYNDLTGEMPKGWLKSCFSLKALFLSQNALEVIPSLTNMSSLRFLLLNNNNFSGMIPLSLFPSSLELLDLNSNYLGGQIPTEMCKLNNLTSIDLSNNNFFGFLPPCFNSPNLLYVYLYKNKLNGSLLPVFKNNTSLVTLDIGDNHLSGEIPEWIGNLRSLSILSLQNNHFEGHIPTQVCSLDQLTILDLSSNNIKGQIPRCLSQITFQPFEIKSIFEEQDIYFDTPFPIVRFLSTYGVVPDYGELSRRYLTFQNEMEITTKSHTYKYAGVVLDGMTAINLACNKLSGEIPPEIGGMIGVRALNLSHNKLTDSIPSSLSKLSQIESLDLSYNNLNGSIPSELTKLYALAVFSVAHNNLSGRTPEQKDQFGTFEESSYEGNPFLCGPPLLNDCSPSRPSLPGNQNVDDVDGSMDMDVFYICFFVTSVLMFLTTLIVLWINPYWRRVWFYYSEMWITWVYYFVVDNMGKAWNQVF